jgi:hypothetical protein
MSPARFSSPRIGSLFSSPSIARQHADELRQHAFFSLGLAHDEEAIDRSSNAILQRPRTGSARRFSLGRILRHSEELSLVAIEDGAVVR